jgi:hypothetical protein
MGEVNRARDTQLGCDIAIKILASAFSVIKIDYAVRASGLL